MQRVALEEVILQYGTSGGVMGGFGGEENPPLACAQCGCRSNVTKTFLHREAGSTLRCWICTVCTVNTASALRSGIYCCLKI